MKNKKWSARFKFIGIRLDCSTLPWFFLSRSVADPGCLSRIPDVYPGSRMFIPDPGSWFLPIPDPRSRISDPGSKNSNKRQGWKNFFCQTIFCSHKFHKTHYYFIFDMLKKKIWPNFPRIIKVFTQKIVTKPSIIWVWDPGSRIQGSKRHRSRIPDLDPQHCFLVASHNQFFCHRTGLYTCLSS